MFVQAKWQLNLQFLEEDRLRDEEAALAEFSAEHIQHLSLATPVTKLLKRCSFRDCSAFERFQLDLQLLVNSSIAARTKGFRQVEEG